MSRSNRSFLSPVAGAHSYFAVKIETQFFSRLRDVVGSNPLSLELPEGATVGDLLTRLYATHPGMQGWDKTLLVAVGLEFADRTQVLHEGDSVSVMPPVQGG